jgi:DNA polymerase
MVLTARGPLIAHNSGFGGSLGAWKNFGADKFMDDETILHNVRAWRIASPAIVRLWYGLEEAARMAIQYPGREYGYRGIMYCVRGRALECRLLSGRKLYYWDPTLENNKIRFWGWNSDYRVGPRGWLQLSTYSGKLCENIVQATARDLLAHGMMGLDAAGYPIVLHVHDEIVAEVPTGTGSVEEVERIMGIMPDWATGWPVKAAGGWRGLRYRK